MIKKYSVSFQQPRIIFSVFLLWLIMMIIVPIIGWVYGARAMHQSIMGGVLCQAVATLAILSGEWPWRKITAVLAFIAFSTLLIEAIGTATGWPFGRYHYTELMQPQLFHVPLLIPLAWFMMLPAAWSVAHRFWDNRIQFAIVSGVAFTAWDLFLDPHLVGWGFWVWEQPGAYFGIPLLNYAGWVVTATVISFILHPVARFESAATRIGLLLIYTITWFLEWFGLAFFWGQLGVAGIGFIVMGAFVWLGWRTPC